MFILHRSIASCDKYVKDMKTKKQIIKDYAQEISLPIHRNTYLAKDLQSNNWLELRFPAYAIQYLPNLRNLKECFTELANIQKENNESESRYNNLIAEFHAVWFISHTLRFNVITIEHKSCPILSPNRKGERSCDILAETNRTNLYFEVKDLSGETLTQYKDNHDSGGLIHYKPSLPSERQRNWINRMLRKSFSKGSDYLICRIPVYSSYRVQGFGMRWIQKIFGDAKKLNKRKYIVPVQLSVPSFFKGVYLIHNRRYLFMNIIGKNVD